MSGLERWAALVGPWQATYQLRGDPSFDADSPSTATVTQLIGGSFVSIAYTWIESEAIQEGFLLVGHEAAQDRVRAVWLDGWHNGERMMVCEGSLQSDGGIEVRGTYPGGPGMPDWGWRTRIEIGEGTWALTMFNVAPDGEEAVAVSALYQRPGA